MATHSCSKSVLKSVCVSRPPSLRSTTAGRSSSPAASPPARGHHPGWQSDGEPSLPAAILPSPVTLPMQAPLPGFDHLGLTSHARLPCLSLAYPTATHPMQYNIKEARSDHTLPFLLILTVHL